MINPGALTHTSYALHDALEAVEIPAVEVHISNVEEREPWRRISVTGPACVHRIYGEGHLRLPKRCCPISSPVPPCLSATVPYGHDRDQIADLRLPEGDGPHPVAVLLHGGFFLGQYTRDLMDGAAVDLTRRGVATWNANTAGWGMRAVIRQRCATWRRRWTPSPG